LSLKFNTYALLLQVLKDVIVNIYLAVFNMLLTHRPWRQNLNTLI